MVSHDVLWQRCSERLEGTAAGAFHFRAACQPVLAWCVIHTKGRIVLFRGFVARAMVSSARWCHTMRSPALPVRSALCTICTVRNHTSSVCRLGSSAMRQHPLLPLTCAYGTAVWQQAGLVDLPDRWTGDIAAMLIRPAPDVCSELPLAHGSAALSDSSCLH